ncbi:septal pore-associated protein [Microdochium nivale]|nr:septal pore-associated protein [Microdochium nivale]
MSAYDYDAPPARRSYREEQRLRPDPRYEPQDAYYRQKPSSRHELVPRPREDSDLSIEEVRRDFPPPGYRDTRRARSAEPGYDDYYTSSRDTRMRQKPGSIYYEEEERTRKRVMTKEQKIMAAVLGGVIAAGAKEAWDRKEAKDHGTERIDRNPLASAALAAGGAFAGYSGAELYNKHSDKEDKKSTYIVHKGRDGRVSEYYSDDEEDPRGRKGNKSFLENALSAAGLGSAIKALTGGGSDDKKSDTRSRRGSVDSRSSRRSRSEDTPASRMQKAAKASLVAGAAEAFRVSKEPGGWKGEKMKRVLTAAAGAAAIDGAQDSSKDGKRHMLEAVVGGLVGNRVINGSRKDIEEDRSTGRSRSRSRSRGDSGGKSGLAALATAGLGALGAKKLMDKKESSKDRSRDRSRRRSYDSYDSRSPSPRRRSRSRSVVDTARRSLAKIGLGSGPDDKRDDDRHSDGRSSSRRSRGHDDRYDDNYSTRDGYMRGGRGDAAYDDRDQRRRSGSRSRKGGRSGSVSSSDLGNSDDDEREAKKMKERRRRHRDDGRH